MDTVSRFPEEFVLGKHPPVPWQEVNLIRSRPTTLHTDAARLTRVEMLLTQVLEENQVLRRQIQADLSVSAAEFEAASLVQQGEGDVKGGSASPTSPEALVAEDPETYRCWETLLQILLLFSVAQEYPEGEAVEESFPEGIEVIEEEPKDIEDLVLFGDLEVRNQNLRPLKSNCLKKRSKKGREVMLQVQGQVWTTLYLSHNTFMVKASAVDDWVAQGITVVQLPGAESLSVKVAITYAAGHEHWTGVTIDVKSAFLYAPIRSDIKGTEERIIVKPPYLLVELGVMHKDDRWWIRKALYGLPTSPRDWGRYRDAEFRAFRMTWRGKEYQLLQTKTDDALWLARAVQEGNVGPIEGVLVVYVDDLAFFAPEGLAKAFISAVQSRWKTSEPAWLGEEPVTFCGIELTLQRTGYRMSQGAYIRELLHRYDVKDQSAVPMTKRVEPERAEALTVEEVREAQALTGALLWVSTRTRPDLSYVVSRCGQQATKAPKWSVSLGRWAALSRNMDSYPFLVPKDTLSVSSGSQGVDPSHEILEGPAEEEDDDEFTEEVGGSSGSGEKPVPKELTYEDFFEEGEGFGAFFDDSEVSSEGDSTGEEEETSGDGSEFARTLKEL
ncbi:Copia protein [Symbiodinium microadriaticum]|uniref:Copia protein n=1 Tax=Symbiodinium microadriaticum TaxID=2951 RepID=A0A1Q9E1G3_SYMMI|nr:Copia protein [Symbiodinium microadriaticum]